MSTVATPTVPALLRRASFWVIAAAIIVVVAIISVVASGSAALAGRALAGDNSAPAGSMALVEVLRSQGVTVTLTDSLAETTNAVRANSTVLLYDEENYLDADQLTELSNLAPRTVIIAPNFLALQALAPGVGFGGVSGATSLTANCAVPAAIQAAELLPGGNTLSIADDSPNALISGCFPSGDNTFSLVSVSAPSTAHHISLVPDARLFNNDGVAGLGNAALALGLLGPSDSLVWYLPTLADLPRTGPPSLADLTPGWVTPVLLLFALVTIGAAIWRGRRFGPLVAENLPVTVKSSETMEGRARLYERSNARLRALDALRVGAVQRLARTMGLGRLARLEDVIGSVAEVTGHNPDAVRNVLVRAIPDRDAELMLLAQGLQDLERAATMAVAAHAAPPGTESASAVSDFTAPPAERMDL